MKNLFLLTLIGLFPISLCAKDTIRLRWSSKGVSVSPKKVTGMTITLNQGDVCILDADTLSERHFVLSGKCSAGSFSYKGYQKVTVELAGLNLTSEQGGTLDVRTPRRLALKLKANTTNELTDGTDTLHQAVIHCKGKLEVSGAGALTLNARGGHGIHTKKDVLLKSSLGELNILATGDGAKGMRVGRDVTMQGGKVTICTTGNYLAEDTLPHFPPMPEGEAFPSFPEDFVPDSLPMGPGFPPGVPGFPPGDGFPQFGDDLPRPDGGFPEGMPEGFQPDSMMMMMPPPGDGPVRKHYLGTTKGMKALGVIRVCGGTLQVRTATPGAEGIEGKKGVELQGGTVNVHAYDDAVNSGGKIVFSGARVTAVSTHNDAVDSNARGEGAITISDGHVEVYSGAGPPEEGFDCDESPIVLSGGEAFSVGSGMGPWPSMPNERTASQPYLLFQNITVAEGDVLTVCTEDGTEVICVKSPVANPMNHSLITSPRLRKGESYQLKINGEPIKTIIL